MKGTSLSRISSVR